MERMTLSIEGMSCGHCVRAVRDALAELPGVDVQRVDVGTATVAVDPAVGSRAAVEDAVRDAGYDVAAVQPA
jgi:copper chaperone CopZ